MRRIWSVTGNLLILAAVAVLAVVLVKYGGLRGEQPAPEVGVFQSPLGPTPPPAPLPLPTYTPLPPPTPTPAPTATPTPRPMPTVPGPLPPGLKIVYTETDETQRNTTFWIASVDNLEARKQLCFVGPHKFGWSAGGRVSPDGSKVAYTFVPAGVSERGARSGHAEELWVIDTDGTHQRKLAEQVGYLMAWSPDSKTLIYGRLVPLEKPQDPNVPDRTDWYIIAADGSGEQLLLSEVGYPESLGYSSDGRLFYYLIRPSQGPAEIRAIDMASKEAQFQTAIDVEEPWHIMAISPDRTRLLLSRIASREPKTIYDLIIFSLDGRERTTFLTGPEGDRPGDHPLNRYAASWSPDGQHLLIRTPSRQGEASEIQIIDLRSRQRRTVLTNPAEGEEFFTAGFWSPDGK